MKDLLSEFTTDNDVVRNGLLSVNAFFLHTKNLDTFIYNSTTLIQGDLATACIDGRHWWCPCDVCFADIQNASVVGLGKFTFKFQRKS